MLLMMMEVMVVGKSDKSAEANSVMLVWPRLMANNEGNAVRFTPDKDR